MRSTWEQPWGERCTPCKGAGFKATLIPTLVEIATAISDKLKEEMKGGVPKPVTKLPIRPKGRPPLILDLDDKLLTFLRAVRTIGGIINIHSYIQQQGAYSQ